MHRLLAFTLFMVFVLAVLLVAAQLTGSSLILHLGGFSGLVAGLLALYMGVGQVINEVYGSRVLPV
jgi:succinate-acetate transporter protein